MLREAEEAPVKGKSTAEVCQQLSVSEQVHYRWWRNCGGLKVDQATKVKTLEKQNARLKRLLAEAELDKAIFKENASVNS